MVLLSFAFVMVHNHEFRDFLAAAAVVPIKGELVAIEF